MMSVSCRTWFELTEVVLQSVVYPVVRETLAHSYSQWTTKDRQCCDWLMTVGQMMSVLPPAHSSLQETPTGALSVQSAISNRSCAVCGTSGSQPSPTGALSVQSAVFTPPAHSHLQPELCPCSLRCLHLRLTAISNRSSVRAVCGVYTSGSQPSPTGALSVQSAVFTPPAHSHLQPELCSCSL